VASANPHAFGFANDAGDAKELTLQLARDDVPISGRIIDLEGRPVAGVTVTVLNVRSTATGSLDDWIKVLEDRKELYNVESEFLSNRLEPQPEPPVIPPVVTGPDGILRIPGLGRERVATVQIEGPTIETKQFEVRTRPGPPIRVAAYKGQTSESITIYGSLFEHVAGPTRTIEGVVRDQDTGKPLAGVMVRGERSLGNPIVYVQSITDAQGKYRIVGLPRGREGLLVAIPPCDFPVTGSVKAALNVPRDEDLPYLHRGVAVRDPRGTGPLNLDINLKRGVWLKGRVIDLSTGQPIPAQVEYFVYSFNPHLDFSPGFRRSAIGPHFVFKDGTFGLVVVPGPGVITARAHSDKYVKAAGIDAFKHHPRNDFLPTYPYYVVPDNYHVLTEIDPQPGTAVVTHDLFVETGGSLKVSVVGPDGKPLAGTWVAGLQDMRRWEKPKSDVSTYSIGGLTPGKGRVLSFLNEGNRLTGELVLRGDETAPQSVALPPSCTLTGRIINGDREPWGECLLDGVDLPGAYPPVDKNGRFRTKVCFPTNRTVCGFSPQDPGSKALLRGT
jgi:hypothetical protein